MAETSLIHESEEHRESHASMYLRVWVALLVLTVLEYLYAMYMSEHFLGLVLGLMSMALVKAGLVGWYFMHLKFEGKWVFIWLIPAGILLMVFICALYPDVGMQRSVWPDYPDDEEAAVEPLRAVPTIALRVEPGPRG
jgi:cytochrome c oxidase subunit IV